MSNGWSDFMNSTPFGGFFDSGSGNKKNAQNEVGNEVDTYNGVQAPTFSPVQQQTAQQKTAAAQQTGPSAYNSISTNPAYTQAQTNQMAALSNLAANGGRNAASDANLAQIQQEENANAAGQRGAIMQQAAQRGQSGSGNSLLAALNAQQGDINNQSARDLGVAGQEAQTALQAGQGAASIGNNLQNQNFGEQATVAGANDANNRFNAQQGTQVNEFNSGQGNQMGEFNAGQGNQIGALNNYTMPQAQFNDSLEKAKGIAGADQNSAAWNTGQQAVAAKKQGSLWNGAFNAFQNTDTGSGVMDSLSSLASGGVAGLDGLPNVSPTSGFKGLGGLGKGSIANPSNREAMLSALANLRKRAMGPKV